jgi:hypothetical protein
MCDRSERDVVRSSTYFWNVQKQETVGVQRLGALSSPRQMRLEQMRVNGG